MSATPPDEVVPALMHQHREPGTIIRVARTAAGWSQAELGRACGYSASQISRWETGRLPLRDVRVLRTLADALRIPPHLFGLAGVPARSGPTPRPADKVRATLAPEEDTDPMHRRTLLAGLTGTAVLSPSAPRPSSGDPVAMLETTLLGPPTRGVPLTVEHLRREVAAARAAYQHGRYSEVAGRLPGLLATAMATHAEARTGEDIATAGGQLADLYTLASQLMVKFSHDQLAWTTADRAMQAACGSDDALTQATARRAWAIVLRRAGRAETAQRLVIDTAAALQGDLHRGPEYLSVYGSLLSTAAYTAAVDGDRNTSRELIDEAVDAAGRLGVDANHRFTAFGPTSARLYRVSIARVLGDYGTAIEAAQRVNPVNIPLAEQRARYWADIARSFHHWGRPEQCYRALLAAEHASPDEVRYRKPIQEITASLLTHPTARTLPGLRAFAARTGTPV